MLLFSCTVFEGVSWGVVVFEVGLQKGLAFVYRVSTSSE